MANAMRMVRLGRWQPWLLLGAAVAATALIALLLSAPAVISQAQPQASTSSQTALFWAIIAVAVLFVLALLLAVILQFSLLARRRAMTLVARLNKSLNQAEAALRAVSECSADGIITVDASGRILGFNRSAERLFGFRAEDVLGQHAGVLLPERHRGNLRQTLAELDPLGWGHRAEQRHMITGLRRDGRELPLQLTLNAIDLAGPRRLVGVVHDLSEPQRQQRQLHEHEQRLSLLLSGTESLGILLLDAQGRVQHCNVGAEQLLAQTREALQGRHVAELAAHEADGESLAPALTQAAADGRAEHPVLGLRPDGTRLPLHLSLQALHDRDGRLFGFNGLLLPQAPARAQDSAPSPGTVHAASLF